MRAERGDGEEPQGDAGGGGGVRPESGPGGRRERRCVRRHRRPRCGGGGGSEGSSKAGHGGWTTRQLPFQRVRPERKAVKPRSRFHVSPRRSLGA